VSRRRDPHTTPAGPPAVLAAVAIAAALLAGGGPVAAQPDRAAARPDRPVAESGPPAAPASGRPAADLLREADAAFEREDYAAARALYDRAVRAGAETVHALRRLALLESWDGDLEASIGHYRLALVLAPGDLEVGLEHARVLSWKNDLEESIAAYRGLRERHPDEPRVLLGLGQALAWKGRYAEAEALYADMVERRIAPIEAHLAHARALGWQGKLERAGSFYRDVLRADPGNLDARIGLARIHHWEGLNRVARAQVDNIVADHPHSKEALELQTTIHDALRPAGEASGFRYSDRDSNRVDSATLGHTFMAEEQTSIRIDYTNLRAEFRCQDAAFCDEPGLAVGDVVGTRAEVLSAGLTSRVIKPLTFHARAGAVRQDDFGGGSRTVGVGGGYLRWQVGPRFAVMSIGGREALLDTAPLIDRGIRVDTANLRLEHRFHPAWLLAGEAGYGSYSDGNFRNAAGVSVQYRFPSANPHLSLLLDLRYRRFHEDLDNGYFDPRRYDSELLTLALWDSYRQGAFFWRLEGTYGRQDFATGTAGAIEAGTDDRVQAVYAAAGVGFGARATLEAFYSRSDYALQLATGFTSSRSGFVFRMRF
jgi:tetratricopeptide (TPR) repeat protein